MRNALDKIVEKIKTHILYSITFFSENHDVYEIMSENVVGLEGQQMTSKCGAYVCILDKQGYMCARACTRPRARVPIRMDASTRAAHTHTRTHRNV
jgi:hypothetical protein